MTGISPNDGRLRERVQDLLGFVIEQLETAMTSPFDQFAAVDAAQGVIPLLRYQLAKDEQTAAHVALSVPFGRRYVCQPFWREAWDGLARKPRQTFLDEARKLIECLQVLKDTISRFDDGRDLTTSAT